MHGVDGRREPLAASSRQAIEALGQVRVEYIASLYACSWSSQHLPSQKEDWTLDGACHGSRIESLRIATLSESPSCTATLVRSLANEQLCFDLVQQLASKWTGVLWRNEQPTEKEQHVIDSIRGKKALYRRMGYDARVLEFSTDAMIGEGAAECERCWHMNQLGDEMILTLARLDRPTCHLRKRDERTWTGQWLEYEQMPIELVFHES